jgi:hypothetical protein
MDNICVPNEALRNHLTFKDWYERVAYQLFQAELIQDKFKLMFTDEEKIKLIEEIMVRTNLIFNDRAELVNYKGKKNRKWDSKITNIVSIASVIVLSNFKITYTKLGSLLGVNHSTLIYYVKRHAAYCVSRDYRAKYFKLLTQLQYERIIPTTQDEGSNPKRLLSAVLSGIKPESGTAALRSY